MINIVITVTNEIVGQATLYELFQQKGISQPVPLYKVVISSDTHQATFETKVTRCSSEVVFNSQSDRFATLGECPPNRIGEPYRGFVYTSEKTPFGIRLYESTFEGTRQLRGTGDVIRTDLSIHGGPGRSEGCMMIPRENGDYDAFRENFNKLTEGADRDLDISIIVQPRCW